MKKKGIHIEHDGIKFLTNSSDHGGKSGGGGVVVLVRFQNAHDLKKALCRTGQYYDNACIQVYEDSNSSSYNNNNSSSNPRYKASASSSSSSNKRVLLPTPPVSGSGAKAAAASAPSSTAGSSSSSSFRDRIRDDGFYIKIYGLPDKFPRPPRKQGDDEEEEDEAGADYDDEEFDTEQVREVFNNVDFVRVIKTFGGQRLPPPNNSRRGEPPVVVMKAKRVCHVKTRRDVERAMTRQDEVYDAASADPTTKMHIHQISKSEFDRELANYLLHQQTLPPPRRSKPTSRIDGPKKRRVRNSILFLNSIFTSIL